MLGHGTMKPFVPAGLAAGLTLLVWLAWEAATHAPAGATDPSAVLIGGVQPALVPTLGQWGLLLLALAMMGVAFWVIRRGSTTRGRRKP